MCVFIPSPLKENDVRLSPLTVEWIWCMYLSPRQWKKTLYAFTPSPLKENDVRIYPLAMERKWSHVSNENKLCTHLFPCQTSHPILLTAFPGKQTWLPDAFFVWVLSARAEISENRKAEKIGISRKTTDARL